MSQLLSEKKCVPCEGDVPKFTREEILETLKKLEGWTVKRGKIYKKFVFRNFIQAIGFVNELAVLAENEGHHPDFTVQYNELEVEIWTHAIKGLSENDFILAAKIDKLIV